MTPLKKLIRCFAERLADRWYDGPDAPASIGSTVLLFLATHPKATKSEWMAFSAEHARASYRAGFRRGFEYVEFPDPSPDEVADQLEPGWQEFSPAIVLEPDSVVID